jgi:hypothetical protein
MQCTSMVTWCTYIFWSKRNLSYSIDSDLELYLLSTCLIIAETIKKKKIVSKVYSFLFFLSAFRHFFYGCLVS